MCFRMYIYWNSPSIIFYRYNISLFYYNMYMCTIPG